MAKAARDPTVIASQLHLSTLIRDPFVRSAFEHVERDQGEPSTVTSDSPRPPRHDGAAARPEPAVRQDHTAWELGREAGSRGLPARCPDGADLLAWWSGYVEGKARRERTEEAAR